MNTEQWCYNIEQYCIDFFPRIVVLYYCMTKALITNSFGSRIYIINDIYLLRLSENIYKHAFKHLMWFWRQLQDTYLLRCYEYLKDAVPVSRVIYKNV